MKYEINNLDKINAIGFIPARFDSERLPGKPLIEIAGKALLQRVWEGASRSSLLRSIIIATDDPRIAELCDYMGAEYIMTPQNIFSGTDRIIYAYKMIGEEADIIVNIQGDEPLITGNIIDKLVIETSRNLCDVGTIVRRIDTEEELINPNVVKVALRDDLRALYFSRSIIPYVRDADLHEFAKNAVFHKHIGIYAYTHRSLMRFESLTPTVLEIAERLEQLRLMESGAEYFCLEIEDELIGVDTMQDVEKVAEIISKKKIQKVLV